MMKIVQNNPEFKHKYDLISNIKCFQNSGHYVAFAGLLPSHFQSGTSVHGKSHISKIGSENFSAFS